MDPLSFHNKIKQLKPLQESKPNTLWIGILHHDTKPSQLIKETDVLWAKCPGKTTISKLKEVYNIQVKPKERNLLFLHDGKVIENSATKVASINTYVDNLVAIEAVMPSHLSQRRFQSRERVPLQPINGQLPTKHLPKDLRSSSEELAESEPSDNGFSPRSASAQRTPGISNSPHAHLKPVKREPSTSMDDICASKASIAAPNVSSGPQSLISSMTPTERDWAYIDFVCERRAISSPPVSDKSFTSVVAEADRDWANLEPNALQQYLGRARRVYNDDSPPLSSTRPSFILNQRAFWLFYVQSLKATQQQGLNPHRDVSSAAAFHKDVCSKWRSMEKRAREALVDQSRAELEDFPIGLPPGLFSGTLSNCVKKDSAILANERESAQQSPTLESLDTHQNSFHQNSPEPQPVAKIHIPSLFIGAPPETLEQGVDKGIEVLQHLRETFETHEGEEAPQWLSSIDIVRRQASRTKTIVGVVGNTGSGKSSTINAILDEERLVPTNCMRACTAVVTEISYNYGEEPYSAEIEFISAEDWRKELAILWKDLIDMSGNVSRECTNEESEAGVAYAKIKAVYPKMTKDDISHSSMEQLMQHGNVSNLFGSTKRVSMPNAPDFYKELQFYVDSKEKSSGDKRKENGKKKPAREMEYWPLIKVVRIYVKSPALSTGAVIVDLPGVHDSNQARAAVAEGYMKQCTGLWIVAPINRAVDDKAAKTLLGDSFKRQLKMDGGFSSVTFICSKTDDISITEASDSLGLDEELGDLWNQSASFSKLIRELTARMEDLKDKKEDIVAVMNAEDEQLEEWEALQDQQQQGKTVYPPQGNPKKRKRGQSMAIARKKIRHSDSDDDFLDGGSSNESSADNSSDEADLGQGQPLTEEHVQNRIAELRASKKHGRLEKLKVDEELRHVRGELQSINKKRDDTDAEIRTICIAGRNQYSKGAIQQDFAAGIKEMDLEIAEEEDAANFDPEVDKRDYDEVARSLQVFCISARGYQKLQGRFAKDSAVPGFKTLEETEIPQLQAHCQRLTVAGRKKACQRFLNNLSALLNSLRFWSCNGGSGVKLTVDQQDRESRLLHDKLKRLDGALQKSIHAICDSIRDEFADNVYQQLPTAAEKAKNEANNTASHWGSPVNRVDRAAGGYFWATYKALCRRNGIFSNAQGLHDWNTDLSEPMLQSIANPWEKCFSRRVPSVLNGLSITVGNLLAQFHKDVETRAVRNGSSQISFHMLSQQLENWKATFRDLATTMRARINEQSKEINRQFVPVITDAMLQAYDDCESEVGPGQFLRMKNIMTRHVDENRVDMFRKSGEAVKASLEELVEETESRMLEQIDQTFRAMKRDYLSAILGQHAAAEDQLPRGARVLRNNITEIVEGTDLIFKKVVGQAPESEPDAESKPVEVAEKTPEDIMDADAGQDASMDPIHQTSLSSTEESDLVTGRTSNGFYGFLEQGAQAANDTTESHPDITACQIPTTTSIVPAEECQNSSPPVPATENQITHENDRMNVDAGERNVTAKFQTSSAADGADGLSEKENDMPDSASTRTEKSIFSETEAYGGNAGEGDEQGQISQEPYNSSHLQGLQM